MNRGSLWRWMWGVALGLAALAGLLALNAHLARTYPGGAAFWPLWRGARAWLLHGQSPYARPETGPAPPWAAGATFDLPLFAALPLLPYALVNDYVWARALWMLTLELSLAGTVALAAWSLHWQGRSRQILALMVILTGPWAVAAVGQGRSEVLLLPLAWLAAHGWRRGRAWPAAMAAAWLWTWPALALPWLGVWGLWLVARPERRRLALAWLVASGGLFALATVLQPGWFTAYVTAWVQSHLLSPPPVWGAPHALALALPGLGRKLGWAVAALAAMLLVAEGVSAWGKSWLHTAWTASLAVTVAPWLGLPWSPISAAVLLWLPWLLVWALWDQRWLYGPRAVVLSALGLWLLGWAWSRPLTAAWEPRLGPAVGYGLLPLTALFGLYFVRWWATHADWWAADERP